MGRLASAISRAVQAATAGVKMLGGITVDVGRRELSAATLSPVFWAAAAGLKMQY